MKALLVLLTLLGVFRHSSLSAPVNDSFENRTVLNTQPRIRFEGTTIGATTQFGDFDERFISVWYQWTPERSGRVSISVATLSGVVAAVHIGDDLRNGNYLAFGPNVSRGIPMRFYAIAGQTYNFYFGGFGGSYAADFSVDLFNEQNLKQTTEFVYPLANDDFDNAYEIAGPKAEFVQYAAGATLEPFEAEFRSAAGIPAYTQGGLWIQWKAPKNGKATFVAHSLSLTDVFVTVARGESIVELTQPVTGKNMVSFRCRRGVTYRLYVLSTRDTQVLASFKMR
jgi:hypothetical protein